MSTADNLSPPGTAHYDSSTMNVGDGTWDSSRNDFLLPNLQGLNFATMQYNGMGNRFKGLTEYHTLILGHGVIAAITFLAIVPGAIFIARFLHTEGRVAFKLHVYMQIITVFLSTVVLILGWFAVGPERSLSNPHHGIGVAIYTCILLQFLYGWWMMGRERKRATPHPTIPVKVHLHRLFGRAVALLAFVQVALGLTLYGSPKVLFVLYALWGAFLLFAYLALEYRNKARLVGAVSPPRPPRSDYYSDYTGSYITGDQQTQLTQDGRRRQTSHWGRDLLAGAGLVGAYEWWKSRRDKKQMDRYYDASEVTSRPPHTPGRPGSSMGPPRPTSGYGPYPSAGYPQPPGTGAPPDIYGARPPSRPPSRGSYHGRRQDGATMSPHSWEGDEIDDEKYGRRPQRQSNTWRDRILGAGAGIAAFEGVKSMFGSKKRKQEGYAEPYRPGDQSMVSQTDVSRVEAGQPPFSPGDHRPGRRVRLDDNSTVMTPTRPPVRRQQTGVPGRRPSLDSLSYDDDESAAPPPRHNGGNDQTLRESVAAMGAIAGFREWNRRRRERREQDRNDRVRQDELESEEQFNQRHSDRYPRPQDANTRRESMSGTIMTGPAEPPVNSNPELSRTNLHPDTMQPPLPAAAGAFSGSPTPQSSARPGPSQQQQGARPTNPNYPIPPAPPGPPPGRPANYQAPLPGSLAMPQGAVAPDPSRLYSQTQLPSSSGLYQDGTSAAAQEAAAAGVAGAAAGYAAGHDRTQSGSPSRRRGSRTRMNRPGSAAAAAAGSGSRIEHAGSPPVSLHMHVHPSGDHVTLRRLQPGEADAERAARQRTRRTSSLSSSGENAGGYRRSNQQPVRRSSDQPITNVPPPPPHLSSSALGTRPGRRDSELNLPPAAPAHVQDPAAASGGTLSPPNVPGTAAGTDLGTLTDGSTFETNRRRRRAERARREAAAGGGAGGNRVEFE